MRPERIELEGFTAFRTATAVDLTDADLFALTGPTGSGKSSIIDALCFALYGSVPRYADKRVVAPVISQGLQEAKVRLDFTLGSEAYTAVRVVRATKAGGATTKEARLERRGADGTTELLAGNEREVTEAVTRLVGLTYEHFTTCVVLPQGEFARFLHQKPSDRQDLLTRLLDLTFLDDMKERAGQRRAAAVARRDALAAELAHYQEVASLEKREELTTVLKAVDALIGDVDAATEELALLDTQHDDATRRATAARADDAALAALQLPPGVDELGAALAAAEAAVAAARQAEHDADTAVEAAEAAREVVPTSASLDALLEAHEQRVALAQRLQKGTRVVAEQRTAAEDAARASEAARAVVVTSRDAVDAAKQANAAEAFVLALQAGEPCPICGQVVHELPVHEPGDVAAASAELRRAEQALDEAAAEAQARAGAWQKAEATYDELTARASALDADLDGQPDAKAARAQRKRSVAAEDAEREARQVAKAATAARRAAEQDVAGMQERRTAVQRAFSVARDEVAALGPPAAGADDLVADWQALVAWAANERPAREQAAVEAEAQAATLAATRRSRHTELVEACLGAGITVQGDEFIRDACVRVQADLEADLKSVNDGLAQVERLGSELAAVTEDAAVAAALAQHLRSNYFEKWVLDSVLEGLVRAATAVLFDLSSETYSLVLDEKQGGFAVVDHANAGQVRPARTLSGGETFLASLALALALADQVAELAAGGGARLESIFLDEGFGTLDADTMRTVADTLEHLRAQGRMVGVITHVEELAEQLPLRYEVRKVGGSATVERVEV